MAMIAGQKKPLVDAAALLEFVLIKNVCLTYQNSTLISQRRWKESCSRLVNLSCFCFDVESKTKILPSTLKKQTVIGSFLHQYTYSFCFTTQSAE